MDVSLCAVVQYYRNAYMWHKIPCLRKYSEAWSAYSMVLPAVKILQ